MKASGYNQGHHGNCKGVKCIYTGTIEKENDFIVAGLKEDNRLYSPNKTPCTRLKKQNFRRIYSHQRLSCPHTRPPSDHNKQGQLFSTSCSSNSATNNDIKLSYSASRAHLCQDAQNSLFPGESHSMTRLLNALSFRSRTTIPDSLFNPATMPLPLLLNLRPASDACDGESVDKCRKAESLYDHLRHTLATERLRADKSLSLDACQEVTQGSGRQDDGLSDEGGRAGDDTEPLDDGHDTVRSSTHVVGRDHADIAVEDAGGRADAQQQGDLDENNNEGGCSTIQRKQELLANGHVPCRGVESGSSMWY